MYRIVCYGKNKENMDISFGQKVVGSKRPNFTQLIDENDVLFLYVDKKIVAYGVADKGYVDNNTTIWPDATYPYRVKLKNITILDKPYAISESKYRDELYETFGRGWPAKVLFTPNALPDSVGEPMFKEMTNPS
jgi:hypothetical protein